MINTEDRSPYPESDSKIAMRLLGNVMRRSHQARLLNVITGLELLALAKLMVVKVRRHFMSLIRIDFIFTESKSFSRHHRWVWEHFENVFVLSSCPRTFLQCIACKHPPKSPWSWNKATVKPCTGPSETSWMSHSLSPPFLPSRQGVGNMTPYIGPCSQTYVEPQPLPP